MSNDDSTNVEGINFCSNCGNPLRPNVQFCTVCGKQVRASTDEITPTQPVKSTLGSIFPPVSQPTQITHPESATPYPMQSESHDTPKSEGIVSSNIRPATGTFLSRSEQKICVLFGLTAMFSHIIRYILIFNDFPRFNDLLLPIPFYIALGFIILSLNKYFMRSKGVDIEFEADNYDYMVSSVLSSFFLSLMNYRYRFKEETSAIPPVVYHPQNSKQGMTYVELPKAKYIEMHVRPQAFFSMIFFTTLLGIGALWWYFQNPSSDLGTVARFIAMYLGGYGVSHLSPRVGRVNAEMTNVGRFRTLFVFIISFFVFLIPLIGENFFIVLQ